MPLLKIAGLLIFTLSVAGIVAAFAGPRVLAEIQAFFRKRPVLKKPGEHSVSIILAARNAEAILAEKMENLQHLQYPTENWEIVFCSDGSVDSTVDVAQRFANNKVKVIAVPDHNGKNAALRRAVEASSGNILVFTDADAIIEQQAIMKLLECLVSPDVGGVCGQRRIAEKSAAGLALPQHHHTSLDSALKIAESRVDSITSNDGKLYAVRRNLMPPLPDGVADDLFVCLAIVRQGFRFVFQPEAVAFIHTPSRGILHEFERRRRIVCGGLQAIRKNRRILSPACHGLYSVRLMLHKVLRRQLPFMLAGIAISTALLALFSWWFVGLLAAEALFALSALLHPLWLRTGRTANLFAHASTAACYVLALNAGMALGVIDAFRGRHAVRWHPKKAR
jgi:cellulose synthase/poly-beta-1,6-N-acetylglucosamine synthase-like glycosyltransferase